jgi:hypothetical protein
VSVRQLFVSCGISALVGAGLFAYKGVAILATGDQPDHAFEVAPFFFGLSAVTLLYATISNVSRPRWLILTLGWFAVSAGAVAAVAHFAGKEDDFGDLAYLVNLISTVVLFFLIGGDIQRKKLLPRWSFTPRLLAWGIVLAIPIGAVLEGIDERLLEVPLLGIAAGWTMLAVATLTHRRPTSQPDGLMA